MSDDPSTFALRELPSATLSDLSAALRDGSLRYGISAGLLAPFAGTASPRLAATLNEMISAGCSISALGLICSQFAAVKAELEATKDNVFLALSGPSVPGVPVVDTGTVVKSLFLEAKHEVLLTSYVFHDASDILAPLVDRCRNDSTFKVRVIVDLSHSRKSADEPLPIVAGRFRRIFLDQHWSGGPEPELWHDPRVFLTEDRSTAGVMHAKIVLIDEIAALITSANFTAAAQDRNIEAGVLIRNHPHVQRLHDYFLGLIDTGHLKRIP